MMCCVLKKCCCCFDLKYGSIVIGFSLMVLNAIWLYFSCTDIYMLNKYLTRMDGAEPTLRVALALSVVDGVSLAFQIIFTMLLVFGIIKSKAGYLQAFYPASVICYAVEVAAFVFGLTYFGVQFVNVSIGVILIANVITKLITPYFLLTVRSLYHQTKSSNNHGNVYNTSHKQSKMGIYYV